MRQTEHLLDALAQEQNTLVSNLRLDQYYRTNTILKLYRMPDKVCYSLLEWKRTLSYLIESELTINSYDDVDSILKGLYDSLCS